MSKRLGDRFAVGQSEGGSRVLTTRHRFGQQPSKPATPAAAGPPGKGPAPLSTFEEELASFTPLSETYDPMRAHRLQGSRRKISWEQVGVWTGIAFVLILVLGLVIYVKSGPKLSDPIPPDAIKSRSS